jgi:hypothetical protein
VDEQLLKFLTARKLATEAGVFTHPPSNWEEFQNRLGRWAELSELIAEVHFKMKESDT